jgi:hypothetical protein
MQSALRICASLPLRALLFLYNDGTEGIRWHYVTGQHLFSSDARPIVRPHLASGNAILSLN